MASLPARAESELATATHLAQPAKAAQRELLSGPAGAPAGGPSLAQEATLPDCSGRTAGSGRCGFTLLADRVRIRSLVATGKPLHIYNLILS